MLFAWFALRVVSYSPIVQSHHCVPVGRLGGLPGKLAPPRLDIKVRCRDAGQAWTFPDDQQYKQSAGSGWSQNEVIQSCPDICRQNANTV